MHNFTLELEKDRRSKVLNTYSRLNLCFVKTRSRDSELPTLQPTDALYFLRKYKV